MTDRPVYVAVRYIHHDGSTAEPAPGTMTPKEIVDRAMHPSVASTTIWCPGVANPEPDADIGWWGERGRYSTDSDTYESEISSWEQEEPVRIEHSTSWARFERSRRQQARSMAEGMPDGDDVA